MAVIRCDAIEEDYGELTMIKIEMARTISLKTTIDYHMTRLLHSLTARCVIDVTVAVHLLGFSL